MNLPSTRVVHRVLHLVVCAASPARAIQELVDLVQQDGWDVWVIPTPVAATWIDEVDLAVQTGHPVRSYLRHPDDPSTIPPADAVAVVPATFNTINKWAAGISDTFALGVLNEALGLGLPIVVFPYAKAPLTIHPAFDRSLDLLDGCGVRFTSVEALRPAEPDRPFRWSVIVEVLRALPVVTDQEICP